MNVLNYNNNYLMVLPTPGSDNGTWGTILNNFLLVSHNTDGTLKNTALQSSDVVQSTSINQIISLSQAAYDALTPDANTLYIIV